MTRQFDRLRGVVLAMTTAARDQPPAPLSALPRLAFMVEATPARGRLPRIWRSIRRSSASPLAADGDFRRAIVTTRERAVWRRREALRLEPDDARAQWAGETFLASEPQIVSPDGFDAEPDIILRP
jgi:hypothetical protein